MLPSFGRSVPVLVATTLLALAGCSGDGSSEGSTAPQGSESPPAAEVPPVNEASPNSEDVGFELVNPLAPRWAKARVGDVLTFQDSGGDIKRFTVTRVEDDLVRRSHYASYWSYYTTQREIDYVDSLSGTAFRVTFLNKQMPSERVGRIELTLTLNDPGYFHRFSFVVNYANPLSEYRPGTHRRLTYAESQQIGTTVFAEVYSEDIDYENYPSAFRPNTPPDSAWIGVTAAIDYGLVQYRLLDGRTYTRVLP